MNNKPLAIQKAEDLLEAYKTYKASYKALSKKEYKGELFWVEIMIDDLEYILDDNEEL